MSSEAAGRVAKRSLHRAARGVVSAPRNRRATGAILIAVLLVLVAACGGGAKGGEAAVTTVGLEQTMFTIANLSGRTTTTTAAGPATSSVDSATGLTRYATAAMIKDALRSSGFVCDGSAVTDSVKLIYKDSVLPEPIDVATCYDAPSDGDHLIEIYMYRAAADVAAVTATAGAAEVCAEAETGYGLEPSGYEIAYGANWTLRTTDNSFNSRAAGPYAEALGGKVMTVDCPVFTTTSTAPADTISLADAANQYLVLIAPLNCANNAMQTALAAAIDEAGNVDNDKYPTLLDALANLAGVERDLATQLLEDRWPANASEAVRGLARSLRDSALLFSVLAVVSPEALNDKLSEPSAEETIQELKSSAAVVRDKLGLPPAEQTEPAC